MRAAMRRKDGRTLFGRRSCVTTTAGRICAMGSPRAHTLRFASPRLFMGWRRKRGMQVASGSQEPGVHRFCAAPTCIERSYPALRRPFPPPYARKPLILRAHAGRHGPHNAGVEGSSPSLSTIKSMVYASLVLVSKSAGQFLDRSALKLHWPVTFRAA
jgi:hypothetical protein